MQCWGGRGEVWERAQRLHDKMKTNLAMAKDRLQFLGMYIYIVIVLFIIFQCYQMQVCKLIAK